MFVCIAPWENVFEMLPNAEHANLMFYGAERSNENKNGHVKDYLWANVCVHVRSNIMEDSVAFGMEVDWI